MASLSPIQIICTCCSYPNHICNCCMRFLRLIPAKIIAFTILNTLETIFERLCFYIYTCYIWLTLCECLRYVVTLSKPNLSFEVDWLSHSQKKTAEPVVSRNIPYLPIAIPKKAYMQIKTKVPTSVLIFKALRSDFVKKIHSYLQTRIEANKNYLSSFSEHYTHIYVCTSNNFTWQIINNN